MIIFISTKQFDRKYEELNKSDQERITEKLSYLKFHPGIFTVLKKLQDLAPATHRLRIGNYRVLLKLNEESGDRITFLLLRIGHRREIYK